MNLGITIKTKHALFPWEFKMGKKYNHPTDFIHI